MDFENDLFKFDVRGETTEKLLETRASCQKLLEDLPFIKTTMEELIVAINSAISEND